MGITGQNIPQTSKFLSSPTKLMVARVPTTASKIIGTDQPN